MTFLAMLIALSLHQVLQPGSVLQRDTWLFRWDERVAERISSPWLRAAVTLGVLSLGVLWALGEIDAWLFGLLELLVSAGLFVWSLGREDYHTALERYEARRDEDPALACSALDALWAPSSSPLNDQEVADASLESEAVAKEHPGEGEAERATRAAAQAALQRLVYSGYARWFAPLFYFVLGGPVAALLYRAVASLAQKDPRAIYGHILRWADWVPARVLGVTFALSGDFMAVSKRKPLSLFVEATPAPRLLEELATLACNKAPGGRVLGDILYRSAGLWLLVLSAVLILG